MKVDASAKKKPEPTAKNLNERKYVDLYTKIPFGLKSSRDLTPRILYPILNLFVSQFHNAL